MADRPPSSLDACGDCRHPRFNHLAPERKCDRCGCTRNPFANMSAFGKATPKGEKVNG